MFNPVRALSRAMLGALFIGGGLNQLKDPAGFPAKATDDLLAQLKLDEVDLPESKTLVQVNGGGMVAAGAALALGIKPRTAAAALAALLVPTTLAGHPFWKVEDPAAKQHQQTAFMSNVAVLGGLLSVLGSKK